MKRDKTRSTSYLAWNVRAWRKHKKECYMSARQRCKYWDTRSKDLIFNYDFYLKMTGNEF